MLLLNVIGLIRIMCDLGRTANPDSPNLIALKERLKIATGLAIIFGLTWSFGFLVVFDDNKVFQYVFCVLGSLHGFFIFLFYLVRNENARFSWKDKLTIHKYSDVHSSVATRKTRTDLDSQSQRSYRSDGECSPRNSVYRSSVSIEMNLNPAGLNQQKLIKFTKT